jgi:hypothetical protein
VGPSSCRYRHRCARRRIRRTVQRFVEQLERRTLLASALGPDGFGYTASAHAYEDVTLDPADAGTFTLIDWADDHSVTVDLASNTFSVYGKTYTGPDDLLVSSNGLISFRQYNSDYSNDNFDGTGGDAVICPLWDDWIGGGGADGEETSASTGMVLGRFESTTGDSKPERLILQWTAEHYDSSPSSVRFQAILQLNTADDAPGDITFNYADLDAGSEEFDNGASATIGIGDIALASTNRLLVSQNDGDNPLVGDHKAIRIHSDATGLPHADAGGPYIVDEGDATPSIALDASHSSDPDQAANTLAYAWDLDGDGVFGETGADATRGEETGVHPVLDNLAGLSTGEPFNVVLRVTDSSNLSTFAAASISITNHPPTAGVSGAAIASALVPYTITLTATDPTSTLFSWTVDWGDGVGEEEGNTEYYSGEGAGTPAQHFYRTQGSYTIAVIAFDDQDAPSAEKTLRVTVGPRPDLLLAEDGTLFISGAGGNDTITVVATVDSSAEEDSLDPHTVRVARNGVATTFAASAGKNVFAIDIDSGGGDDRVDCTGVFLPLTIVTADGDDTITCGEDDTLAPGDGDDGIFGGEAAQYIDAGDGDDLVLTGNGSNTVLTGDGADTITTGVGVDRIDSGGGDDSIDSGEGFDDVDAGEGDNHVRVDAGNVMTGDGNDVIIGSVRPGISSDAVTIQSGDGDDSITTGDADDYITFGTGNDTVVSGGGNDVIRGGGDAETGKGAIIDAGTDDLSVLELRGDNDAVGCDFAKSISTGPGDDAIGCLRIGDFGGGGIHAGDGDDRVRCASDDDHPAVVFGDGGDDDLHTGPGDDSVYGGSGRDTVHAGDGDDLITGAGGNDRLFGQDGNDQLYGGRGNDRLEGQGGDDRLVGGSDADLIRGGEGTNTATRDDPLDELTDIQTDLVS